MLSWLAPMRNEFRVKKLALLLVGAATLSELFDAIKLQYQLVLNFFHLKDAGMVLVRGVKDVGEIRQTKALKEAYDLGVSIDDESSTFVKPTNIFGVRRSLQSYAREEYMDGTLRNI